MIEKTIAYKNDNKEIIISLKKLGLSDKEIELFFKKYKRKKFDDGGSGGDGGGDGGGDSGGDSGDSGDAGDSGTGQSGAQSGDNTDGNNADGTSGGPGAGMGGPGGFGGDVGAEGGFGIGPGDETTAAQSVTADDVSMAVQAAEEDAATAAAAQAAQSQTGIIGNMANIARAAMNAYANFSPTGLAVKGIMGLVDSVTKGKTSPDDFSQAQTSVQVGPSPTNDPGGGITTIPVYAPLYNTSTGDNTIDALIAIYRKNLGLN